MSWLVVGANGMLGTELVHLLSDRGEDVVGIDRGDVDITRPGAVEPYAEGHQVVVNCAAFTAVDRAEEDEPAAFAVNAVGAANVARAARRAGARVVQISTDYVFPGDASQPYAADAPADPRSAYGRTKLAGEWAVQSQSDDYLVVRTAWLYGAHGPCFPATITRLVRERGGLDVVDDQRGQPTWTFDLSDLVHRLVVAGVPSGVYHGTSSGETTWFEFARAAVASAGMSADLVRPTTSEAFVRPAARPAYSVLDHDQLRTVGVEPIGDWAARWALAAADVLKPAGGQG